MAMTALLRELLTQKSRWGRLAFERLFSFALPSWREMPIVSSGLVEASEAGILQ
jgi:hypothetical protein